MNRLRRRRELRFRRRLRVTGAGLEHHVGFTQDVSEAGLFVATNRLPTKMELIALTVELPSGQLIQLNGRVKWLRDPPQLLATVSRRGFGVLLSDAPPEWTTFVSSLKGKRTA